MTRLSGEKAAVRIHERKKQTIGRHIERGAEHACTRECAGQQNRRQKKNRFHASLLSRSDADHARQSHLGQATFRILTSFVPCGGTTDR